MECSGRSGPKPPGPATRLRSREESPRRPARQGHVRPGSLPCFRTPQSFSVRKQVRSVIELVRMHKIIDIYNTREEALRSFSDEP